jgi:VIT1/CCC1 family predicted Fe2+/Mn2+ transporter
LNPVLPNRPTAFRHRHRSHRSGWLRAAVLGANDGILSISSLMLGVAADHASARTMLVAGLAGLVAGALSMGAGEYVSVSSQADAERADLELERRALDQDYHGEHEELRDIYVRRGLDYDLATRVSRQLMQHDALGAHARDEIGITETLAARPVQAALTSTLSFALGGTVPFIAGAVTPYGSAMPVIAGVSLVFLAGLGALAARAGGASMMRGSARVIVWGAIAMAITIAAGRLFGATFG